MYFLNSLVGGGGIFRDRLADEVWEPASPPYQMALLGAVVVFSTFCNFQMLPLALWERVGVRDLAGFGCTAPW
jgi:hypothetical protein